MLEHNANCSMVRVGLSTYINRMKEYNVTTFNELEFIFESKVLAIASSHNMKAMVWQDVFNNGVKLPEGIIGESFGEFDCSETVVEVWRGADYTTLLEVLKVLIDFV